MPSVTFTPAGNANAYKEDTAELPGKTVITVTEGEATNTYTINYALSQEILATDFTIASTNISGFATYGYVPNAVYPAVFDGETVVSDTKVYTDRISYTNYHIREVNDDFLLGADLIRGSVKSQTDATYTGNAIPDWIKFKAARGVTAVILCCEETGKTNFEANSFVQSTNNSGFIKTYTNQNKTYKYAYTKHFDANTTVQIPNAAESVTTSMLVALIWDDWVEPQTMQDITLHADALSKNALVILVPKNYQKDVLVQKNEDGTYSDITWVEDKTKAISAYDYEYDENGDPIFKWDASRATGDFCKTGVVNVTSGDATITSLALKSLFPTDGEYVLGSRPATDRYPIGGGHFLDNMPEELYNTNYIVVAFGAGKGYTDVDYTFSVNDNLKKIVVLDINDVANPTIGETVSTEAVFSGNDKPCYMMQSMQASHKVQAHNALSCFLAKGLMTEDDIYGSDGFKIRRYSVLMAIDTQGKNPIESMMSAELYARASDESREGDVWFFGESGMENTALVTDLGLTENITTNYSSKANQQPQIREFSSQAEELNELVFVNAASANYQGKTVSYPAWLEAEDCTYIAPYWNWTDISTKDDFTQNVYAGATAIDMYSFKVTKDCTVMMALKGTPDDFWALSEGWTKTALTDDDMIVINRQHRYPSQHFKYNQLFTKDFEAGSTVTIKTPQADKILPLVFVKPVDK